jgi:RNA-directed DNA polymerase
LVHPGRRQIDCRHLTSPRFARSRLDKLTKTTAEWYRKRNYLHFDEPIQENHAAKIVTDPNQVAAHPFFPLIYFKVESIKVKRNKATKKLEPKTKSREISYASHLDSHIYSYYANKLSRAYEASLIQAGIQDCVLAFRPLGKSNIQFAAEAFQEIKKRDACHVIGLDIEGFFDNLNHIQLKDSWARLLASAILPADHYAVFRSLTKYARVSREKLYETLGLTHRNFGERIWRVCAPKDFREKIRSAGLVEVNATPKKGIPQGT